MPEWLWYAVLGANLGSLGTCWYTIVWYVRRYQRAAHAQLLRWQRIEEEQARAWRQRRQEVQAACPVCGLARAEEDRHA
jgi:hypothetical protein